MTVTPAGWYPDPQDASQLRYWDGQSWTDHTAPSAPPASPAAPPPPPASSPYGGDPGALEGGGYPSYPTYPAGQLGVPSPYVEQKQSNTLSIIGIVCGAFSLIFCPFVLGIAGLVLGGVAKSKNEPLAKVALIVSAIGLVGGIILNAILLNTMGEL